MDIKLLAESIGELIPGTTGADYDIVEEKDKQPVEVDQLLHWTSDFTIQAADLHKNLDIYRETGSIDALRNAANMAERTKKTAELINNEILERARQANLPY